MFARYFFYFQNKKSCTLFRPFFQIKRAIIYSGDRMTVYIDVLLLLNTYINYLLLSLTAKILHIKLRFKRCIITSFFASFLSFFYFLPEYSDAVIVILRVTASVAITFIAFGKSNIFSCFKNSLFFSGIYFIFSGFVSFISGFKLFSGYIGVRNMTAYSSVSMIYLVILAGVFYIFISIAERFFLAETSFAGGFEVIIKNGNDEVRLKGIADTGNTLVDCFSGKSVIVTGREALLSITGMAVNNSENTLLTGQHLRGYRVIPYSTCSQSSVLPVFIPDKVVIRDLKRKNQKTVDVLIGVTGSSNEAIFNPKLLI